MHCLHCGKGPPPFRCCLHCSVPLTIRLPTHRNQTRHFAPSSSKKSLLQSRRGFLFAENSSGWGQFAEGDAAPAVRNCEARSGCALKSRPAKQASADPAELVRRPSAGYVAPACPDRCRRNAMYSRVAWLAPAPVQTPQSPAAGSFRGRLN